MMKHEKLILIMHMCEKLDMLRHSCNPRVWESEMGDPDLRVSLELHSEALSRKTSYENSDREGTE